MIRLTCTRDFARFLLQHPAVLPPSLIAHPKDVETYQISSISPSPRNQVAVSYVSQQLSSDIGSFVLTMTQQRGRWLVSGLNA